jgi:hypothetical protein
MSILDILKQYAGPSGTVPANAAEHFDTVAQQAAPADLGGGIAAALRSTATPSFGQTIGSLFGRSDPQQQAGVLNQLIQAIGPAAAAAAGGGVLQRVLGTSGTSAPISPAQASQVTPAEVSAIAAHAENQNGSVVDQLSNFYAQHPTLVKSLGVAALGVVMSHMSRQQQ